ncbi:TonB-dependent receptor [Algibacter amylolyticus]|uniref:TonB-dependent receptor n=2 Tax=Algibacter amylolyticus TaxID=1608400 RepID=A0A5M7B378_9FLAO|nr:TonB-dependent receptor [Algibacter amylolyticus]KAA5823829.1 TonB-dependent receptor [Algibacter amylolyticus]TSJ74317.1 TonB-dependent receptor [Algibacter amylolyticus]
MGQNITVSGKVTDANGQSIPGATIIVKGTATGAVTDFDGVYNIQANGSSTIVVSYIGFETLEIPVNNQKTINIQLKEDISLLDEVVVVGYGTQKKSDVTGSVSSANLEAFKDSPNTNAVQALQGTVPGLNIGQVNSAGSTPSISIRGQVSISGNQDVLIILDGIQYNGSLSSINPDDIKSVDVLKDASSTAVYGAQAANGVILITTKSGKRNQTPKISFSSSYTTQTPSEDLRPMNRNEYIDHIRRINYQDAYLAPDYTTLDPNYDITTGLIDQIISDGNLVDTDFDWWGEGTKQGNIKENRVSATGGSEKVSYLLSLGLTEQEGYIINDKFKRKSIRINVDTDVKDWWTVGVQSFGSFVNKDGDEPSLYSLAIAPPLLEPYDEEGNLIANPTGTLDSNPFLTYDVQDYERHDYLFANVFSEIKFPFLPGLSYRVNFGNNYRISKTYGSSKYSASNTGDAGKNVNFYKDYTLDNILTYKRTFGKHNLTATYLYGAMEREGEGTSAYAKDFDRLGLGYNNLGIGGIQETGSSAFKDQLNYQMFRVNYKFDEKYILTGTIRKDGYSGFAENNKTAYFPTGAFAWVISNEGFLSNSNVVNNLKLRAGYGINGNQTGRYTSLANLKTVDSYVFGDGGSTAFGQEVTSLANADLKWEKTKGLNVGLDFGLFSNRLKGSVDVYKNTTDDLLFRVAIPYLTGFDGINTNVGKMENKGIEIALVGDIVKNDSFKWTSTISFSKNENKILELTGEDEDEDGIEDDLISSGLFIGESINAIYDYEIDGIYQLGEENIPDGYGPGTHRIVDQDGVDGITPAGDRKIIGTTDPAFRASLLNSFSYKQFTLNVFLNTIQGGKNKYLGANTNALYRDSNTIMRNYISGIDFWTPTNPDGVNPVSYFRPAVGGTRYVDRSFVRLQDVNLSYKFSKSIVEKLALSDLSIYVSGKNLATWTKWDGWDPETGQAMNSGGRPVLKGYSLGVNLSF